MLEKITIPVTLEDAKNNKEIYFTLYTKTTAAERTLIGYYKDGKICADYVTEETLKEIVKVQHARTKSDGTVIFSLYGNYPVKKQKINPDYIICKDSEYIEKLKDFSGNAGRTFEYFMYKKFPQKEAYTQDNKSYTVGGDIVIDGKQVQLKMCYDKKKKVGGKYTFTEFDTIAKFAVEKGLAVINKTA